MIKRIALWALMALALVAAPVWAQTGVDTTARGIAAAAFVGQSAVTPTNAVVASKTADRSAWVNYFPEDFNRYVGDAKSYSDATTSGAVLTSPTANFQPIDAGKYVDLAMGANQSYTGFQVGNLLYVLSGAANTLAPNSPISGGGLTAENVGMQQPCQTSAYAATATQSTTTLTVTGTVVGTLSIGQQIVIGSTTEHITALGTGTGAAGTYMTDTSAAIGTSTPATASSACIIGGIGIYTTSGTQTVGSYASPVTFNAQTTAHLQFGSRISATQMNLTTTPTNPATTAENFTYYTDARNAIETCAANAAAYSGNCVLQNKNYGVGPTNGTTLDVPYGVVIRGGAAPSLKNPGSTTGQGAAIILGPGIEFNLSGRLKDLAVLKSAAYAQTTNAVTFNANLANYRDEAVTLPYTYGSQVQNVEFIGFATAIDNNPTPGSTTGAIYTEISDISGYNLQMLRIDNLHDLAHWDHLHFNANVINPVSNPNAIQSFVITSFGTDSGQIEVGWTSAGGVTLARGNQVTFGGITSATGSPYFGLNSNRYTVSKIVDSSHFDLAGTTGGATVSSPTGSPLVYFKWAAVPGPIYSVTNSEAPQGTDWNAIGADTDLYCGTKCGTLNLTQVVFENDGAPDNSTHCIIIDSTAYQWKIQGNYLYNCGVDVSMSVTSGTSAWGGVPGSIDFGVYGTNQNTAVNLNTAFDTFNLLAGSTQIKGGTMTNQHQILATVNARVSFEQVAGAYTSPTFDSASVLATFQKIGGINWPDFLGGQSLAGYDVSLNVTNGANNALNTTQALECKGSGSQNCKVNLPFFINSGLVPTVRIVTSGASTSVTGADVVVEINKTTGSATAVSLLSVSTGFVCTIKDGKGDAATNNITITPASGTIDGSATYVINTNHGVVRLQWDGAQWTVL